MLALHRSGRRGDALAAYDNGRRLLRDEFGIEPDSALTRVRDQILAAQSPLPERTGPWSPRRRRPPP